MRNRRQPHPQPRQPDLPRYVVGPADDRQAPIDGRRVAPDMDDDLSNDEDSENYEREDRFWRWFARSFFILTAVFLFLVGVATAFSDPIWSIPILLGSAVIGYLSKAIK